MYEWGNNFGSLCAVLMGQTFIVATHSLSASLLQEPPASGLQVQLGIRI